MKFTTDQLTKINELQVRLDTAQAILRQTAAKLRAEAGIEAISGEAHCSAVLQRIAQELEDTSNGKQ